MKKFFVCVCLLLTLSQSGFVAPTAHAQRPVVEIGPNVVQNTANAFSNALSAGSLSFLATKELTLDSIAYGLARIAIQSMVRSIINWINSGFQGSPAFMTDLRAHLLQIADQVVGDTVLGSDLAFLCSPFQLDVRIAVATNYNSTRDGYQPQCTIDDISQNVEGFLQGNFQDGGWNSWFELTQTSSNDPNRAFMEASLELDAAIRNAQGEAITELDWGDGFLSYRVCGDSQAQSGTQTNCTITTPGRVIADQLNGALGAGRDMLITADEINEIIGALLAQLAQQALTGAYGVLGLGGNSSYSSRTFGTDGGSTYLDALAAEQPAGVRNTLVFETTLERIDRALDARYEIVTRITEAQTSFNTRAERLTDNACTPPAWPTELGEVNAESTATIARLESIAGAIEVLRDAYASSTDPTEQSDILEEYTSLERSGELPTTADAAQLEFFIEFELSNLLAQAETRMARAESICFSSSDD